jgi:deoxyribose-phosphate aldolase
VRDLAALIDHTLLKPQATAADIRKLCQEARQYQFMAVCVNPYWVALAVSELAESQVRVATVADVALMRRVVGPAMGVKASGGVRTLEDLLAMTSAGANRIGTSAGVHIMTQSRQTP